MSANAARRSMKLIGVILVVAATVPSAISPAFSAEKTHMTAVMTFTSQGDPESQWVQGGILHIRSQPHAGTISGDLNGDISNVANLNLNLSTGHGDLWGTYVINADGKRWEGRFSGEITPDNTYGEFNGRTADGEKQKGTFDDVAGSGGSSFVLEWVASS